MLNDPRYITIYEGLNQLEDEQLIRLKNYPMDELVLDSCNYDEETQRYCPLAIAVGGERGTFYSNNVYFNE